MGTRRIKTKVSRRKIVRQLKSSIGAFQALEAVSNPKDFDLSDAPTLSGRSEIALNEVIRLESFEEDLDGHLRVQASSSED